MERERREKEEEEKGEEERRRVAWGEGGSLSGTETMSR